MGDGPGAAERAGSVGRRLEGTSASLCVLSPAGGAPGCCCLLCVGPLRLRPTGRSLHVERLSATLGLTHRHMLHSPPPALLCPTDSGCALRCRTAADVRLPRRLALFAKISCALAGCCGDVAECAVMNGCPRGFPKKSADPQTLCPLSSTLITEEARAIAKRCSARTARPIHVILFSEIPL